MSISLVYFTAPSREEALQLARAVVRDKLAACANVFPGVTSIYEWKGATEESNELVVVLKTRAELVPELIARVAELHSYECPCVVSLPIDSGHLPFLGWVTEQTVRQERESSTE